MLEFSGGSCAIPTTTKVLSSSFQILWWMVISRPTASFCPKYFCAALCVKTILFGFASTVLGSPWMNGKVNNWKKSSSVNRDCTLKVLLPSDTVPGPSWIRTTWANCGMFSRRSGPIWSDSRTPMALSLPPNIPPDIPSRKMRSDFSWNWS